MITPSDHSASTPGRSSDASVATTSALVEAFGAFVPAFGRWAQAGARGSGASYARLRVLDALHCDGPLKMHEIGERLGVTARNVTSLVDGLEAEALVRRVPHPGDRRATIVELTADGERSGAALYGAHRERAAAIFGTLPPADQADLLRIIDHLRAVIAADEADRSGTA